ncbi:hypothetical protein AVEN_168295-1, partial [Araneus ventricosus]
LQTIVLSLIGVLVILSTDWPLMEITVAKKCSLPTIASNQGCGAELHLLRCLYVPPSGGFGPLPVMAVSTATSVAELLPQCSIISKLRMPKQDGGGSFMVTPMNYRTQRHPEES